MALQITHLPIIASLMITSLMIKRIMKYILNIGLLLLLSTVTACVTTERGGIGSKIDDQKAVEYSVQLARSYIQAGNWEAAKRHLKNALDIDKSSAEIYEALALVFQNTGEVELAEKNYKRSIKLAPKFSRVRNNYAAFLYQQQRYRQATKEWKIVVADTLYPRRSLAYVHLGRSYAQLDELEKAEDALHRAYLMERRNVPLMYELADVYYRLQDYPKSQQFYNAYRSQVKQQQAPALWLGIRLAKQFDNQNDISSYALALKNLYPTSKEYLEYKRVFGHDG